MRIVTLLPAATEIVCALGLRDRLVGRSHECDFPEDVTGLPALTRMADILADVRAVADAAPA
jgi:iron complex transport system substrate-binding protein